MSSPSNLYAEKIYAEQPIALWSLDDDCTFVSYFPSGSLDLHTWTGATTTDLEDDIDPFPRILQSSFVKVSVPSSTSITLQSPTNFSSSENFSAGLWVNPQNAIASVEFMVGDTSLKTFSMTGITDKWVYLGHLFETSSITNQPFKIKINGGASTSDVYLNAFSIGVNQNLFGTTTTGNQLETMSPLSGYGVIAYEYGVGENNGWYVGNQTSNKIYAKNSSLPLVYGAKSSTVLYPNPDGPSLIVPGMGFLNESGKNQRLTFEAWLRVKTDGVKQSSPFRIVGPLGSSDGLYVNGQHLILKVGDSFNSHYVGEWFRPMLVNVEYTPNLVRLFVNGEVVCSIEISSPTLASSDNQYLGFYAGDNVDFIEVDCIAIYPYRVSPVVARRRFGYGQAVSLPSEIETAYSGKQTLFDYTFAGYSSDYSYPKVESWASSTKDAVYNTKSVMGSPVFGKPQISYANNALEDTWEKDLIDYNGTTSDPFIKFDIGGGYSTSPAYLSFRTVRQPYLRSAEAFYVICDHPDLSDSIDEIIFRVQDPKTLDSISAIRSGNKVNYYYNISGKRGTLGSEMTITSNTKFVVGLRKNTSNQATHIKNFLFGLERYRLFIGGDYSGTDTQIATTFTGKIFKVAILSPTNFIKESASSLFDGATGRPLTNKTTEFISNKPSYTYKMSKYVFNDDIIYKLTTASMSYWQDYLPLAKFAKQTSSGYVSDMLQFSINAEHSSVLSSSNIVSSNVDVKSYISFAYSTNMLDNLLFGNSSAYTVQPLSYTKVVDATSSWSNKKFEVVDGTVIHLPNTNFITGRSQENLSMITAIDMYSDDTDSLPIRIRSIEYAAQTFNRGTSSTFNKNLAKKIGTRTISSQVYSFAESEGQFDYSLKNPIAISKSSNPYLYASNRSGIKVLGSYGTSLDRGLYFPVNSDGIDEYYISMLTFYGLFNDNAFPTSMTVIEAYDDRYEKIKVLLKKLSNTSDKAYISVVDKNDNDLTNIEVYINGIYSPSPTIDIKEWASIGILFTSSPLDMSSKSDFKIEVVGSMAINNLSYFQLRPEELAQQILPNEWNDYDVEQTWDTLDDPKPPSTTPTTWSSVAASQGFTRPSLDPEGIANIYYGTNKIFAINDNDDSGIGFENFTYDVVQDVVWQKTTTTAP